MLPKLTKHIQSNFRTLERAFSNGDLALVLTIRKSDKKPVAVVCAMQQNEDETITPIPLAEMIDGNPFEMYEDPTI